MKTLRILLAALLAVAPLASASALDRVLPAPRIKDNGDIRLSDDVKLGRFQGGKYIGTPDKLEIQGPGSTGEASALTVTPNSAAPANTLAKIASFTLYHEARGNLVLGPSTYNPSNSVSANLWNTAAGIGALAGNPNSGTNAAFGHNALGSLTGTSGGGGAAFGDNALANTQGPYSTGVGSNAGRAWTTGSGGNVAVGHGAAGQDDFTPAFSTSAYNTFIGSWSGQEITSGGSNSCLGMNSCMNLTSGQQNTAGGQGALAGTTNFTATAIGNAASYSTAWGYNALQQTISNGQVGVGYRALVSNTTGTLSTAVGYNALQASVADVGNNALGNGALYSTNGGNYNNSFGRNALSQNVSGSRNTVMGDLVANSAVSASDLTAVGNGALFSATSGSSTAVGSQAGAKLTTGTQSAFFGDYAGNAFTTGTQNTSVGSGAGSAGAAATLSNTVSIGYQSNPTLSNQVVLGNTSTTQNTLYGSLGLGSGAYLGFTGGAAANSGNFALYGTSAATVLNTPSGTGAINFAANNTTVARVDATAGAGKFQVLFSTPSTSTATGSLVTAGGAGIAGALYLGGGLNAAGLATSGGTVKGTVCVDTAGIVYVKTTAGACL